MERLPARPPRGTFLQSASGWVGPAAGSGATHDEQEADIIELERLDDNRAGHGTDQTVRSEDEFAELSGEHHPQERWAEFEFERLFVHPEGVHPVDQIAQFRGVGAVLVRRRGH